MSDGPGQTPAPLTLRPASEADLPALLAIYAHHVLTGLASFELDPPSPEEFERRWRHIGERGLPFIVAERPLPARSAPILGYAYAGPYRPRPAYRHTVENSLYVAADAQRIGVGRALLSELISQCEALGLRQMVAIIGDSDNAASIGLHLELGFRRVGTLEAVGFKFDRWVDSVILQRRLGSGSDAPPDPITL